MKARLGVWLLLIVLGLAQIASAQSTLEALNANVFVRGARFAEGVRYTATLMKPTDDALLRNLSIEITLPAGVSFTSSVAPKGVEFHVVRKERNGRLTLIWQDSRILSDETANVVGFVTAQALNEPLEFYAEWRTADDAPIVQNFLETPVVVEATVSEGTLAATMSGWAQVGDTGVFVGNAPPISVRLLPNNFNPPLNTAIRGGVRFLS